MSMTKCSMALWVLLCCADSGCSGTRYNLPETQWGGYRVSELRRSEYSVGGEARARACRSAVGLWPIPIWFVWGRNGVTPFGGIWGASDDAHQAALEAAPQADLLLEPRVTETRRSRFWYDRYCVEVRGKTLRILTDAEIMSRPIPAAQPGGQAR